MASCRIFWATPEHKAVSEEERVSPPKTSENLIAGSPGIIIRWVWRQISGPIGAAALIIGFVVQGPALYNVVFSMIFDTHIDTENEESLAKNIVRSSLNSVIDFDVSNACEDQDDDCYLSMGGSNRGTCYKYTEIESMRYDTEGSIHFIISGQWKSETKYTNRVGPFMFRLTCSSQRGTFNYVCSQSTIRFSNLLNDTNTMRNQNCAQHFNTSNTSKPYENEFVLDVYLRRYIDQIAKWVEDALTETVRAH